MVAPATGCAAPQRADRLQAQYKVNSGWVGVYLAPCCLISLSLEMDEQGIRFVVIHRPGPCIYSCPDESS